jgi:hypothetical protein
MVESIITATRDPSGVRLTWYARGGTLVAQMTLEPRCAVLLGLDLVNLAVEPLFRATVQTDPAPDGPEPGSRRRRKRRPKSDGQP